ncbi:MAG: zinc-ribbon domain-containing protein [Planctomycetota bacterium]
MADPTFFDCPNCGAEVPDGALACPECGSDGETGWSEDTAYDGLDLPDLEDANPEPKTPSSKQAVFTIAAVLLLIAFFAVYILGIRF